MAAATFFTLEHFYFGQREPGGERQLLAASPDVLKEHIAEAVRYASIPPLPGVPTGSWSLVRGKKELAFVLVQAQQRDDERVLEHYVLFPADTLRTLAGNLQALVKLVESQMPDFSQTSMVVKPLRLAAPDSRSTEAEIDQLLELMNYTHNQTDLIETMLAAIVQGVPLVVQGAPDDLATRVKFIEGLLALLPASARFGVTFSTHVVDNTDIDTQIRFFGGQKLSRQTLVYGWERGKVGGNVVEDDYSHFIVSQLRLDAELVTRQTRSLKDVAAWRIRRGDGLAEALGYVAHRFRIDDALMNNQPVESAEVSKVLAEDPTLSPELKIKYTQHLLAFALALNDMTHAEPIAPMLRENQALEQAIADQFEGAIREGKAGLVFEALSRWLANPLGPSGMRWVDLTHQAALARMEALVKEGDSAHINKFLELVHYASPGLEISRVVPRLVERVMPLALNDRELNLTVFLLAVNYLDIDRLRGLLKNPSFITRLPPSLGRLAPYLSGEDAGIAPGGLLVATATDFGDEWRDPVLIRLAEAAIKSDRADIIDTPALGMMVGLLGSAWGTQYRETLHWIVAKMSNDDTLRRLEPPGPSYMLQILLASGGYADLASEMLHQARTLYPGEKQDEYIQIVQRIFAETPLAPERADDVLKAIEQGGIRSLPLLMAYIGVLEGSSWSSALDPIAEEATERLFNNPEIIRVIPSQAMIALLKFHIKRKDVEKTIRAARLMPSVAIREGTKGINLIGRMYTLMDWDERIQLGGLELLRRYVRQASDADARRAVVAFGREFGQNIEQSLTATYLLRQMMDSVSMVSYAEFLRVVSDLLYDMTAAYADKGKIPSLGAMLNSLDSLNGSLTRDERAELAEEMLNLGRAIIELGKGWVAVKPRDGDKYIEELLKLRRPPASGLDVFWSFGGYLSRGTRAPLRMDRALSKYVFAERSAPKLNEDTRISSVVLQSALKAFPSGKKLLLTMEAVRTEMDSLWGDVPEAKRREIIRELALDFQHIAELAAAIAVSGNPKVLELNQARGLEENKQQPKNPLEMIRFVSGYFRQRS